MSTSLMVSHWTKLWWRGLEEAFQVSCKELTWLVLLFGNLIKKKNVGHLTHHFMS